MGLKAKARNLLTDQSFWTQDNLEKVYGSADNDYVSTYFDRLANPVYDTKQINYRTICPVSTLPHTIHC